MLDHPSLQSSEAALTGAGEMVSGYSVGVVPRRRGQRVAEGPPLTRMYCTFLGTGPLE